MTMIHGFEEIRRQHVDEINGEACLFRHAKTGAQLLSLVNNDENKVFGIAFRTPPADSTGIAHILEHSVLCGSRKFPVKDPFIRLAQSSLNTFLNAMTYPDKTMYPTASQNLQDFYNLIDVYLDAVLHPLISREILEQEGWHYEIDATDAPLIYKGVVFNEMKGAYSSPDALLYKLSQRSLFPDTTYGLDSGGDPKEIPNLTYEAFKAFHASYYHPSNARIYFYGDDDPIERLRLLDERLGEFSELPVNSDIALQSRFEKSSRIEGTYATGKGSNEARSHVTLNWMLGEITDPEKALALSVLDEILAGTSASPLHKALIDSGLGEEVFSNIDFDLRQPIAMYGLKGIDASVSDKVEALILNTLEGLSSKGFDADAVEAALNTVEFKLRENNTGRFPRGLSLMLRSLTTWLYDRDPLERIAFAAPLEQLKAQIASGEHVFEGIVQELFIENSHRTTVLIKPDPEQAEFEAAEERKRLAEVRAGLDQAEIDRLIKRAAELKRWQNTPDTTEAIATIPSLSLSDLPKRNKTIPCHLTHVDGVEVLYHELPTNGIIYLDLAFDLHPLLVDQLPILDVFARSLLETGAGDFDFVGLTQRIGRTTGGISASSYVSAVNDKTGCVARLIIRAKAVPEKADELVSILQDVLLASRIDDRDRIKQIVLEEKASAEAMLTPMGHLLAARRVNAGLHEAGFVQEQISGLTRLFGLRTLAGRIYSDWPSVAADLEAMRRQLITKAGLVTSVTADKTTLSQFNSRLETLITALPSGLPDTAGSWAWTPVSTAEGFAIPAKVNYVAKGGDLRELGLKSTGAALVAQNLLSTTWLWDKVRLQGGAYGGFCRFDRLSGSFSYISYRDPNLLETLEVYDSTAQHLRQAELGEQELKRAIIGTIGSIDTYLLPDLKGLTSLQRHLARDSDDARQVMRDEVLATTAGDLRAIADVLDALAKRGRVAILGSDTALASANKVRGENWLSVTTVM